MIKLISNSLIRYTWIGLLLLPAISSAQTRMVLDNTKRDKQIIMEEGDKVRVMFRADSVLDRAYRPLSYRRKDKRVAYVQGRVLGYTDSGFTTVPQLGIFRRIFSPRKDTLEVSLDQVMAINRTNTFQLVGTSALSQAGSRVAAIAVLATTGNAWLFLGVNAAGFIVSPFTRRWVRGATTPMHSLPEKLAKWRLYLEHHPEDIVNGPKSR